MRLNPRYCGVLVQNSEEKCFFKMCNLTSKPELTIIWCISNIMSIISNPTVPNKLFGKPMLAESMCIVYLAMLNFFVPTAFIKPIEEI